MNLNHLLRQSQFHGGRRLAEQYFRLWWVVGLVVLFGAAVAVVRETVQRYWNQPTFLAQEEMVHTTAHFPSVFVCPEVFYPDSKIDEFLENMKLPPSLNMSYIRSKIHQLAAFTSADALFNEQDLGNLELLLDHNGIDLYTAGRVLTPTCEETLIRCRWRRRIVNCSKLFHMELTGDGYCCVFNGRSLRTDFMDPDGEEKYINHDFGIFSGLMLAVNQSQTHFNVDLSYKWLALQASQHFVESTVNGTALNPGSEQWAAYSIQNFQIEEETKRLSADLRQCRMRYEHLTFFPQYSRRYCIVECEMQRALAQCKCVLQIHPRPPGVRYCRAHQLSCAKHAKVAYDSDACDCPIACDVARDYVKSNSFHLVDTVHPLDTFYADLDFKKVTIVRAFMESGAVKTNTRQPYFTNTDLFGQLGGVFNMFFGVSILTILELGILCLHWLKSFTSRTISPDFGQTALNAKVSQHGTKENKKRHIMNVNTIT